MDACFTAFDKDEDGFLSLSEFELICRALFRNDRGKIYGLEENQLNEIYSIFDTNGDGFIDRQEFEVCVCVCVCLRACGTTDLRAIICSLSDKLFLESEIFDETMSGNDTFHRETILRRLKYKFYNQINDKLLFQVCWNRWIKVCTRPRSAFLIVDVQNDFITGSLNITKCAAQHDGSEVIEPINRLLKSVPFDSVFYSLDWHPVDHVSFIDNLHLR